MTTWVHRVNRWTCRVLGHRLYGQPSSITGPEGRLHVRPCIRCFALVRVG